MKRIDNYKSLIIGTRDDCLSCKYAYAITLNLEPKSSELVEIKKKLKEYIYNGEVLILEKLERISDETTIFEKRDLSKAYTFNSVIFGNQDSIVAIVKFFNPQSTSTLSDDIIENVRLELTINPGEQEENNTELIKLVISFSGNSEIISERNGISIYQFKPSNYDVQTEAYNKYTSRIGQLLEDPKMAIISGECGVSGNSGSCGFWIRDYEEISGFDKVTVCLWNSDVCVLKYDTSTCKYELNSMTKDNIYGKSWSYKSGRISILGGFSFHSLLGTNIIYSDDFYYHIYSISDNISYKVPKFENGFPTSLVSDPWGLPHPLLFMSSSSVFERIKIIAPSEINFDRGRDSFLKKTGSWYKLNYGSPSIIIYIGPRGIVYDYSGNLMPLTENLFLYNSENKVAFIPINEEITSVSEASDLISKIITTRKRIPKKKWVAGDEGSYTIDNGVYTYSSGKEVISFRETDIIINGKNSIETVKKGTKYENLNSYHRIIIDGLRRKPFRISFPDPNKIITLCGLIFYIEDNKLFLL